MNFECQKDCGKCCKGEGRVHLTPLDVLVLAARLNYTNEKDFIRDYVDMKDGFVFLRKTSEDCRFLKDDKTCGVHGSHPTQCRTFPFWRGNLKIWEELHGMCPGMGQGPVISEEKYLKDFQASDGVVPGFELTAHFPS